MKKNNFFKIIFIKFEVDVELFPQHVYTVVIRESGKDEVIARFEGVNVKMDYVNKVLRIENSQEIYTKAVKNKNKQNKTKTNKIKTKT